MLQGSLDNFSLDEVLGLLSSTSKTGILELKGNRGSGSLKLNDGYLVAATASNTANGVAPEDVLFELLRYSEGTFSFSPSAHEDGTNREVADVVAAAEYRLSDWRTIESVVPSLRHTVAPSPNLPSDEITINRDEWTTLIVIGAGCPVAHVCEELGLGEVEGSRRIKGLAERGLVGVNPPKVSSSTRRATTDTPARSPRSGASDSPRRSSGGGTTGRAQNGGAEGARPSRSAESTNPTGGTSSGAADSTGTPSVAAAGVEPDSPAEGGITGPVASFSPPVHGPGAAPRRQPPSPPPPSLAATPTAEAAHRATAQVGPPASTVEVLAQGPAPAPAATALQAPPSPAPDEAPPAAPPAARYEELEDQAGAYRGVERRRPRLTPPMPSPQEADSRARDQAPTPPAGFRPSQVVTETMGDEGDGEVPGTELLMRYLKTED